MNSLFIILGVVLISFLTGYLYSRRLVAAQTPAVKTLRLMPGADPFLSMVLRANHAEGIWVAEGGQSRILTALRMGWFLLLVMMGVRFGTEGS